ncbi:MAG: PIG-L domain-containing protein [Hyphomicrobium sp.]|nr:MAG: PIG-L domain-containing protein [Hyphomicrobium sp.]PPD01594.1 MAG: PIG-L domain-containing protein [Hyphomicrobium sp.]
MKALPIATTGAPLSILAIGAHSDDIEIGAGGTLLSWLAGASPIDVDWCVLSANGPRNDEARASADAILKKARTRKLHLMNYKDGYFPAEYMSLKNFFQQLKDSVAPDIVLTHHATDAHQDHRLIAELTTNTFRNHLVLGYEIPKWDGDLSRPNMYFALSERALAIKIEHLMNHFATQRSKDWFDDETFRGLARLRGMECRAPENYAEAFHVNKILIS